MRLRLSQELVDRKRGHPLLLGSDLDQQVWAYVNALHLNGGIVNTAIVIATGEGIIKDHDSNLLCENRGHIKLTKDWAKYLLQRMNFVKRHNTSTTKVSVENFNQLKTQFLFDIKSIVEMEEIPPYLIINWEQTAIKYVLVSSWTMASEGAKRVQVIGADDIRIRRIYVSTIDLQRYNDEVLTFSVFSIRLACDIHRKSLVQ